MSDANKKFDWKVIIKYASKTEKTKLTDRTNEKNKFLRNLEIVSSILA